jgi:hypothetical protein
MLEFTFVGIPIIFVLISIFEISRGMWVYHTMAHAVKEGLRYTVVHGRGCEVAPNSCAVTVGDIARRIRADGIGLLPEELNLTLTAEPNSPLSVVDCQPLTNCLSGATAAQQWPQYPSNQPGMDLTFSATYPFRSAISLFWPGKNRGVNFGVFTFPARSTEVIQF